MKKILLLSTIVASCAFADMMTDLATDAAKSQAKSEARSMAVEHIAGDDAMKKELVNKGADKVLGKQNPMDKMKAGAMGSMMGSGSSMSMPDASSLMGAGSSMSMPDAGALMGGSKKDSSLKGQAVDMAAGEAEKAVGKETLKKETAKSLINQAI